MDQAKLGKETQLALREKEDEAQHWRKMYAKATGGAEGEAEVDGGEGAGIGEEGAGALGVDERVKLQAEVWSWTGVGGLLGRGREGGGSAVEMRWLGCRVVIVWWR